MPETKDYKVDEGGLAGEFGYLCDNRLHPKCVEVEVRPRRYYNSPEGSNYGPGSKLWVAEAEIEPNAAIFVPTSSPEYRKMKQAQKANRGKPGSQTRA